MKVLKIVIAALMVMVITAGNVFAQQQGRMNWNARVRMEFEIDLNEPEIDDEGNRQDYPGVGFFNKDNLYSIHDPGGSGSSWDTMGELLLWYGINQISMWGIITYRQGWGFETKYNLAFDNARSGNAGGKLQIGSRWSRGIDEGGFHLFKINRISMYGWWQAWNKRIYMEMNPFGTIEAEWGPVWRTPANLFHDRDNDENKENTGLPAGNAAYYDHNYDVLFRMQVRNVVDNLNFGFTLPHFGQLERLQWDFFSTIEDGEPRYWTGKDLITRASLGFTYSIYDLSLAGGFKGDPDRGQRAYLGGEYKLIDQRLGIRADFKLLNLGDFAAKNGDLDMAQGVLWNDGPLNIGLSLYQWNLLFNDNKEVKLEAQAHGRYVIVPRRLMGRLRFSAMTGVGEEVEKFHQIMIEPGVFWAMGPQSVTDDLGQYIGMFARVNFLFGKDVYGDSYDLKRLMIGFRWTT